LADHDPEKVRVIQRLPIIEYYFLLNTRVKINEAEKRNRNKK
jgi:hypothetical protein